MTFYNINKTNKIKFCYFCASEQFCLCWVKTIETNKIQKHSCRVKKVRSPFLAEF